MKRLFAVLLVLVLLCSCANRSTVEKPNGEKEIPPQISNENEQEASAELVKESKPENNGEEQEFPDGYREVDFGDFSVLVSEESFAGCAPGETVTMENNQFVGENAKVIAELLLVESVVDSNDPFAPYDEKYSDSVNTIDLSLGGFASKKYHIQTQEDGALPIKTNRIFYCIALEDKMITFAYYPVMGLGGLHTEDIEAVLNTIK